MYKSGAKWTLPIFTNKQINKQNLDRSFPCKKQWWQPSILDNSIFQAPNLFSSRKKAHVHELITQALINHSLLYKIIGVAEMAYFPFDVLTNGFIWR